MSNGFAGDSSVAQNDGMLPSKSLNMPEKVVGLFAPTGGQQSARVRRGDDGR
jgi:hypothetical protein